MSEPPPPSNSSTPKNDSSEARPSLADDLSALKLRGAVKNNPLFRKFESDNQNRLNKDTNKVTLFANEARVNTGRISSVKESVASVGAQQQPLSPKPVVSPSPTVQSNPFKLADNRRLSVCDKENNPRLHWNEPSLLIAQEGNPENTTSNASETPIVEESSESSNSVLKTHQPEEMIPKHDVIVDSIEPSSMTVNPPETSFQQPNNEQIGPDSSMLLLDTSTSLPHFMNDGIDVSFIAPDALPSASPLDSSRSEILDSTGQDCSGLVVIQDSVSAENKISGGFLEELQQASSLLGEMLEELNFEYSSGKEVELAGSNECCLTQEQPMLDLKLDVLQMEIQSNLMSFSANEEQNENIIRSEVHPCHKIHLADEQIDVMPQNAIEDLVGRAGNSDSLQSDSKHSCEEAEITKDCVPQSELGKLSLDLLPQIKLDLDTNWFSFSDDASTNHPKGDAHLDSELEYMSRCVKLSTTDEREDQPDVASSLIIAKPGTDTAAPPEPVHSSSTSTLDALFNVNEPLFARTSSLGFDFDESPSIEVNSQGSSLADISDIISPAPLQPTLSAETLDGGDDDDWLVAPKRSSSLGNLWRRASVSSVFSGKSWKDMFSSKKKGENGEFEKRRKSVRWGLARAGELQQTKTYNPESPVTAPITASLDSLPSTTKPVLLFRLDSIDQLSLPETQPVTINMTLTLANTTTITIPPITVTSTEHPIPIDFECSFHLPQEHPSPPLDITIRVAPVMSLGTEIKRAAPLVSTSSRSIALPNIFKTKAGSGMSAKNSKAGLPLGGLSTRGVLIDNVKRFAEVDCPRRVGERSWTAEFGEGRVGMRVHVKGVSILTSEKTSNLPETFSEAAHGVDTKLLHESVFMSGYLLQMGGGTAVWERRYCKLEGPLLRAYEDETCTHLIMTINLRLAFKIKSPGVTAVLCPKSDRFVASTASASDSFDLGEISQDSIPKRSILLPYPSQPEMDENQFEIEMKDGEIIRFSTVGKESVDESFSDSVLVQPWWKLECGEDEESPKTVLDRFCSESDFFDECFEDIEIKSSAGRKGCFVQREFDDEVLLDTSGNAARRWLHALAGAVLVGDEEVPDWVKE